MKKTPLFQWETRKFWEKWAKMAIFGSFFKKFSRDWLRFWEILFEVLYTQKKISVFYNNF